MQILNERQEHISNKIFLKSVLRFATLYAAFDLGLRIGALTPDQQDQFIQQIYEAKKKAEKEINFLTNALYQKWLDNFTKNLNQEEMDFLRFSLFATLHLENMGIPNFARASSSFDFNPYTGSNEVSSEIEIFCFFMLQQAYHDLRNRVPTPNLLGRKLAEYMSFGIAHELVHVFQISENIVRKMSSKKAAKRVEIKADGTKKSLNRPKTAPSGQEEFYKYLSSGQEMEATAGTALDFLLSKFTPDEIRRRATQASGLKDLARYSPDFQKYFEFRTDVPELFRAFLKEFVKKLNDEIRSRKNLSPA